MDSNPYELIRRLLKHLVPFIRTEFVSEIQRDHGFLNFPPKLFPILSTTVWANLYEDRKKLRGLFPTIIFRLHPREEQERFLALDQSERAELIKSLKLDVVAEFEAGRIPFLEVFEGLADPECDETLETVSEEDQEELALILKLIVCFVMTHISTFLALMSFGQTMCDLVDKAKGGDDDAFCKAVQIDRTVLFGIPFFQQRLIRAQAGYEPSFLNDLAKAIKGRPLSQKLRYPILMIVFYVLDDEQLLDMPLPQLLDLCEELGLYGREFGVEDVESLRKRRQYYYKMSGRQTPI